MVNPGLLRLRNVGRDLLGPLISIGLFSLVTPAISVGDELTPGESLTTWNGVYSEEQASRGQGLIDKHCALCHGKKLRGTRVAPAMAGVELLSLWDGRTLGELLEYMRTTMPPGQTGIVSDEKYVDIVATMLKSSGFPDSKLPEIQLNTDQLYDILIRRQKTD